jgi:hypothetical protein
MTSLPGWSSTEHVAPDGSLESHQSVRIDRAAVPCSEAGALRLSSAYWQEVERATSGLVRVERTPDRVELRVLGVGPALLRLGGPEVSVAAGEVVCRHVIEGGLLACRGAGSISFAQLEHSEPRLVLGVTGFLPRFGPRPGFFRLVGVLYANVQSRVHVHVSRRYLERLIASP